MPELAPFSPTLIRGPHDGKHTPGTLYLNNRYAANTLEDVPRVGKKVPGETRIPAGVYSLALREYGTWHEAAKAKFGNWHRGMIEVLNVPNFSDILIHWGNWARNTDGCILVGHAPPAFHHEGFIGDSVSKYKELYGPIADAIQKGPVRLTIIDGVQGDWI